MLLQEAKTKEGFSKSREAFINKADLLVMQAVAYEFGVNGLGAYSPLVPVAQVDANGGPFLHERVVRIIKTDAPNQQTFMDVVEAIIRFKEQLPVKLEGDHLGLVIRGAARVAVEVIKASRERRAQEPKRI